MIQIRVVASIDRGIEGLGVDILGLRMCSLGFGGFLYSF